jgi:predicted CXXCH cytochrome family protein
LALLLVGGAVWLFLAAIPAFADGGPHISAVNNGSTGITADSCAGCHRVHTAQGPMLLKSADEEALCLSCHGAAGVGATTDVATGIQYRVDATTGLRTGTQLGALRGGGFEEARIGDPFRYTVAGATAGSIARLGKVQVAAAPEPVTSAHMPGLAGLTQPGVAWGNGDSTTGVGPARTVTCGSCHNPHGNGQYRILNKIPSPEASGGTFSAAWVINVFDYSSGVYTSVSSMGVLNGDLIVVTGNSFAGANTPAAGAAITMVDGPDSSTTPDDNRFTLAGMTAAGTGTGGTATRVGGTKVTDAALPPIGDARNYTVIQTQAPYTLLASQAAAYSSTSGDYFHYRVPWNGISGTTLDAPNGIPGGSTASTIFTGGFGEQMAAWCASCHTRYWAWQEPTEDTADGAATGPAYNTPRPGDDIFKFQHRTRGASGRGCLTCHVSHGSNAQMTGTFSSTYTFPNGTASNNSRLLKVDNRGTCQQCHDPTGTSAIGDQYPPGPVPSVP